MPVLFDILKERQEERRRYEKPDETPESELVTEDDEKCVGDKPER